MYIDKSFQLLSADSGKVATDEARRQNAGDDDAEFSELLGAELNQQEQPKEAENAAGSDKKSGQEVAALLTKQAKTAEQINAEKSLADKANATPTGANDATDSARTDKAADSSKEAQDAAVGPSNGVISQVDAENFADAVVDLDAEQVASSNPWLAIISQSHDFTEILSQSSQQSAVATHDAAITSAERMVAELLGVPATETAAAGTDPAAAITGQSTETADNQLNALKQGIGKELAGSGNGSKTLADTPLLSIAEGPQDAVGTAAAGNPDAAINTDDSGKTSSDKPTKFPAEQMTVREMFKADQPHLPTKVAEAGEPDAAVEQQITTGGAAATSGATAVNRLQISAETVAAQSNQTESKAGKNPATAPVDIELPIEVSPDIAALSTVVAESATTSAKNAPQSFAQFQKAANAAAALVQKQQLQAEQTQQPLQDSATQQQQKFAELNQTLPGTQADTPLAFNTLLQTERPISSSGSAMGSSTGQQQHQAASQLFATKLSDSVHSSEQPALHLFEPNAATQLKERVMFQLNQKIHSAEIKLAPEELGTMQIKVQLQQEQLSVQFVVQQAGAKEALEQQMPRLREMLEEQGIELTDGQVSQQREGSDEQRQARERSHIPGSGADMDEEPLPQQAMISVSDRMVDYYA